MTRVYWHRELPPLDEEPDSEQLLEAESDPVPYRFAAEEELWLACEDSLRRRAIARLQQEVVRLGGSSAHVTDEKIEARHDQAAGTYRLKGTYAFVLYRPSSRRVASRR